MLRTIFRTLIKLHPPGFRSRNGEEMLEIFDRVEEINHRAWFTADAFVSLARQWMLRRDPPPQPAPVNERQHFS